MPRAEYRLKVLRFNDFPDLRTVSAEECPGCGPLIYCRLVAKKGPTTCQGNCISLDLPLALLHALFLACLPARSVARSLIVALIVLSTYR